VSPSRVGCLGIRETAELLDNRFSLLWRGRRTALPRHETLNAMLDWSYSLLSELEKVVLCRLSVFVGDFTRQAAGSIASETELDEAGVVDAVASLVAKSLISTTAINESAYHRLLDTTRASAVAKLAEPCDLLCQVSRTRRDHPVVVWRTRSFGIRWSPR
jgi:predicted ATPase